MWARLAVVVLLSGTILWWPYGRSCGLGLALYLTSTVMIIVGGVWVAGRTWTLRMSRTHVLAMLVSLWGIGLVALAALPHTGLARAGTTPAMAWSCAGR